MTSLLALPPLIEAGSTPVWNDVADFSGGEPTWQSRRRPDAFSRDGGRTYYLLNDPWPWWRRKLGLGRKTRRAAPAGDVSVGNSGLRRMLIALAQRPQGLTNQQLGVRAGVIGVSLP